MDESINKLIHNIQNHDSQVAFRELYNLFYDRLFRIAYYYARKDEWAQEVVLDFFLTVWQKRKNLNEINKWENYCFISIKNASLNLLEKKQREKEVFSKEAFSDEYVNNSSTTISPEEKLLNEELFNLYEQALSELPTKCREVYLAIKEDKQTYAEVAESYHISRKTVDAQVQKATLRLKEKIKKYFQQNE